MRRPRPAAAALLLLPLLGPASGARKNPQIYSIHPTGGPVRGGTQLEVRGKDLDDQTMECNFGNSEKYLELSRTPCKFDTTASPARQGDMCLCVVPALHQLIGGISFGEYQTGDYRVQVSRAGYDPGWTPFPTTFAYFEYNKVVNVTALVPSVGDIRSTTYVTVVGNGFVDYGGIYCSFPGARWNEKMPETDPEYRYTRFMTVGTLISEKAILCRVPPLGNNTSPVFLEVCINGDPDEASPMRRRWRDEFCTSSLHLFEWIDVPAQNLTVWNASAISSPTSGGTEVVIGVRGAHKEVGVMDYGKPTCYFGDAEAPATLHGYKPLRYAAAEGTLTRQLFGSEPVVAYVARQRMCRGPDQGALHDYCSCANRNPLCGCGCRGMLPLLDGLPIDECTERGVFVYNEETGEDEPSIVTTCGPSGATWHVPHPPELAPTASCVAPPHAVGQVRLEYSPAGTRTVSTLSDRRKMRFEYYESLLESFVPRGSPLGGGTPITVSGHNLWAFGVATIDNINGSARVYDDPPLCFYVNDETIASTGRSAKDLIASGDVELYGNSSAEVAGCSSKRKVGWTELEDLIRCANRRKRPCEPSGCRRVVCSEAPPRASTGAAHVFVSLNGQPGAAQLAGTLTYYDNELVHVSSHSPRAGPTTGGTLITVLGSGLAALGVGADADGAACLLCDARYVNCGVLVRAMPATVVADGVVTCNTSAADAAADSTNGKRLLLGLSLNGQPNALKMAEVGPSWYFVDLSRVTVTAADPHGGPINGGTPLLLSGERLRACDRGECPDPPLCVFTYDERRGRFASSGRRSETSTGELTTATVAQFGGLTGVICPVPASGLASEALTGISLSETRRRVKVTLAPLGHTQRGAVLEGDVQTFTYYDAMLTRVMPLGGPRGGGSTITLVGSGFSDMYTSRSITFGGGSDLAGVTIAKEPSCVWLHRGAAAEGRSGADLIIATAAAVGVAGSGGHRVTCVTPSRPFSMEALEDTSLELSLNGYPAQRTASEVSFGFYYASVDRLEPIGGPELGGTPVTLHGRGLADFGGYLPGGGLKCKFKLAGVSQSAFVSAGLGFFVEAADWSVEVPGSMLTGGRVVCAAPRLDAASGPANDMPSRLPPIVPDPTQPNTTATVHAYLEVVLTLNGDMRRTVDRDACNTRPGVPAGAPPGEAMSDGCYALYRPGQTALASLFPLGGPHEGGTRVTLQGRGFVPLGGVGASAGLGCRFGALSTSWQPATRLSDGAMRCVAPVNGPLPSTGRISLQVTINGIDPLPTEPAGDGSGGSGGGSSGGSGGSGGSSSSSGSGGSGDGEVFYSFYNARHVTPRVVEPAHGGALGSTLVTVHGTGFHDLGGLMCRFAELPPTAATLIDAGALACRSPPNVHLPSERQLNETRAAAAAEAARLAQYDYLNLTAPPYMPPPPPSPTVPVRVILNGEADSAYGAPGAPFTFTDEPCGGTRTLRWPAGAFSDGLLGNEHYTAARNCSWLLAPRDGEHGTGPLLLVLTHARLSRGLDTLTIHAGADEDAPLLRELPEPPELSGTLDSYGCGPAAGACTETLVVESGPLFVRLVSASRAVAAATPAADAEQRQFERHTAAPTQLSTARVSASFHALANRTSAAEDAGESRGFVPAQTMLEPDGFRSKVERGAAAWRPDMDDESWPGAPATWEQRGGAAQVQPDGTTQFIDVGDNFNHLYQ